MEGVLWKWTNYWNGWQTRWFVLENGILSYYKSQEEVNQGCKGSVKVSVCQINVSAIDNTRMDLVIPGQQHMYLRAPSSQDRQKWLVALGSAKACLQDASEGKSSTMGDIGSLAHRRWELTLYCDLMMQQVHAVKTLASESEKPDVEKLSEASSLLTSTCDTFIRTLEDIMKLTHSASINDIPNIPSKNQQAIRTPRTSLGRSMSQENR